jgi:hypothetical protein
MRKVLLTVTLIWCLLFSYSQLRWSGVYYVVFNDKTDSLRERKLSILTKDSVSKTYAWSFEIIEREKTFWKFKGNAIQNDKEQLLLYVDKYEDLRKKHERKVNKKVNKSNPFYVISINEEGLFCIRNTQGRKKQIAQLIKVK